MAKLTDDRAIQQLELISKLRDNDIYTYFLKVTSSCENHIVVNGKECINFISNNYLGFSTHSRVKEACLGAIKKYGLGMGGSPLASGTTELHIALKRKIAEFYEREAATIFPSGYQAILGAIQASIKPGDVALLDSLVHRSVVDGVILSRAASRSWLHNDMSDLEFLLNSVEKKHLRKLIIVDSVYSMEGDLADLPGIYALKKKHDALLLIDEAHALGIVGKRGAGLMDHYGLDDGADIIAGTFSKFAGAVGGFVVGTKEFVDAAQHIASPFVFSASIPPVVVAGVLEAFKILEEEPQVRENLWSNVKFFMEGLKSIGFDTGKSETPVIPLMIKDPEKTMVFNRKLLENGIFASPVVYPGVPPAESRIRLGVMATHTRKDLEKSLDILKKLKKLL